MIDELTPREIEIARMVARGLSDKQLSQALGISVQTVRNHQNNIRSKLNVSNRTRIALYAIANGLVESPCCAK